MNYFNAPPPLLKLIPGHKTTAYIVQYKRRSTVKENVLIFVKYIVSRQGTVYGEPLGLTVEQLEQTS
jgi:hypothetical protein